MNQELRNAFPLLRRTLDGKRLTYLDSAATSLKPQSVIDAEVAYLTRHTANVHRGKHALSEEASGLFEDARRATARFLNAVPDEVIFLKNTTEALNQVAAGLQLNRSDRVLCLTGEHHSNLVPWLARATVSVLDVDPRESVDPNQVRSALDRERPKVLALGHASNVTGAVHPVAAVCALARERGVLTVVDAAQSAPHFRLDVQALGCDFLAFSAHKMLGPTGVGVLWGRHELLDQLLPLSVGGGTVDRVTTKGYTLKRLPGRLEAGTPNIGGVLGFAAALAFLDALPPGAMEAHERQLADRLEQVLLDLPGAEVWMATTTPRLALASVAFKSKAVSADQLAVTLSDSFQIMVRSGYHCAHPAFDRLNAPDGALRASAYVYNTLDEIDRVGEALRTVLKQLGRQ